LICFKINYSKKNKQVQAIKRKDHMSFSTVVRIGQCLNQHEPKTPTRKDVVEQKNEMSKMKHLMANSPRMLMEQWQQ
jgi:hypothetical protein